MYFRWPVKDTKQWLVKLLLEKRAGIMSKCTVGDTSVTLRGPVEGHDVVVQLTACIRSRHHGEVYSRRESAKMGGQLWKQGSSAAAAYEKQRTPWQTLRMKRICAAIGGLECSIINPNGCIET